MNDFRIRKEKMPLLFLGHGNPMYAIEDNEFTQEWSRLGKTLPKPEAVLCISAHWETGGTFVTSMENPETIHDFYGFPKELFEVNYPANGSPPLAELIRGTIKYTQVSPDLNWGLDHGCWSVLKHIYPNADVPVVQLSLNANKSPEWHFELGKELSTLRKMGILIIGSGNIVHNLRLADWRDKDTVYDWALEINEKIKKLIIDGNHKELINIHSLGRSADLAVPTLEHYLPLLYILGIKDKEETVNFLNDKIVMGSLSMTSLIVDN